MSDYVELLQPDEDLSDTRRDRRSSSRISILRSRRANSSALIGHSGCGKSTVLSMVAGLNEITGGGIILAGKELVGPGRIAAVVFQSPCLLPWMTRVRKCDARRRPGILHREPRKSGSRSPNIT